MTKRSFDSNKYWQDRHDKFLDNSQGVGNISYSQDENDQIYINARRRLGQVLDAMKLPGDRTALDLGCGIGLMATPFLERGINYFGMDISATAIELATESYPEASFLCGDITSLNLDRKFDLIQERTVFIHLIEEPMWLDAIKTVRTHLHEDGVFLLQDNIPAQTEQTVPHVKFRSLEEYHRAFGNPPR